MYLWIFIHTISYISVTKIYIWALDSAIIQLLLL